MHTDCDDPNGKDPVGLFMKNVFLNMETLIDDDLASITCIQKAVQDEAANKAAKAQTKQKGDYE